MIVSIGDIYHKWIDKVKVLVRNWMYSANIKKKIKKLNNVPKLSQDQKKAVRQVYQKANFKYVSYYYHQYYYAQSGIFDIRIIPDNLFHLKIKSSLNNDYVVLKEPSHRM